MNYWLIKSEHDTYSIDHLKRDKHTPWEGVRNYQARNFMQAMRPGDLALFYHSSTKSTGVYGLAKVTSAPHPDMTQFDKKGHYFEPRAAKEKPVWYCVDFAYVETFKSPLSLVEIKADPRLEGMKLRSPASRLSVQTVSEKHFEYICKQCRV